MNMRILVTNDDGIHSDGLIKLEEALKEVGDVYVVAPASEMSGASHSLTLARPLRIRQLITLHPGYMEVGTASCTLCRHALVGPGSLRPAKLANNSLRVPYCGQAYGQAWAVG